LKEQQGKMADMTNVEIKPELAEFPDPPVVSKKTQDEPGSENGSEPQSEDGNH
jgi:hypothetical protein